MRLSMPLRIGFALALFVSVQTAKGQTVRYSADDPFLYIKEERLSELIRKLKERKAIELLLGEGVEARPKQGQSARLYFPRGHPGLLLSGYVDAVKIEYSESGTVVRMEFTNVMNGSDAPGVPHPPAGTPGGGSAPLPPRTDPMPEQSGTKQPQVPPVESANPKPNAQPGK